MALKYKRRDKVRIKSLDWYNKNKKTFGDIKLKDTYFTSSMKHYCGEIMTIENINYIHNEYYYIALEDGGQYYWTDEMIEGLVEEETKPKFKVGDKVILDPYPCVVTDVHWRDSLHGFVYTVRGTDFGKIVKEDELVFRNVEEETKPNIIEEAKTYWDSIKDAWICPEGYIFKDENGNVINAKKIVLEKKSPKTDDIINWLREHDMTKYIGVIYSGMCSITFDTEKLIKDITEMIGDE